MVDLMMWLVIAALLLAAAIQSIGYYQQGAYLYQMKEAVNVASSKAMAESANNNGRVTPSVLTSVVDEENASTPNDGVTLTWETVPSSASGESGDDTGFALMSAATAVPGVTSSEVHLITASHQSANKEVKFYFGDTASRKNGMHVVNKDKTDNSSTEETVSPSPTPTATATATTEPSPTPTPTPTPTATTEPNPPATSIVAGANISAHGTWPALFTDRSAGSTTSNKVQYLFTIPGVTSISEYEVVWSGTSLAKTNTKFVKTDSASKYWFIDVTPTDARGFTVGESYFTATVKNVSTGETSVKTWKLTVTESSIQAHPVFTDRWTDRTVSAASSVGQFVFHIPGQTIADYTVEWSGGSAINASPRGSSGSNGGQGPYWFADVVPANANGFVVGSDTITAKVTHPGSGAVFTKSWTFTVTDYDIQAHASFGSLYTDRSTKSMSKDVIQYVFTVNGLGANADAFNVEWTSSANVNATLSPRVGGDKSYWFVNVTPNAEGFTTGSTVITAKLTHPSGKVLTKSWNLTVTDGGIMAHASYTPLFADRTAKVGSTGTIQYLFTMPGNYADYSVAWSNSNVAGLNSSATAKANSTNKYWFVDVVPATGGFTQGSSTITATVTHIPTGNVYTKTWNLTINP